MNTYEPTAPVVWSLDERGNRTTITFNAETPIAAQNTIVWIAQYPCQLSTIRARGAGCSMNARKNLLSLHLAAPVALNSTLREIAGLVNVNYAQGDKAEIMIVSGGPTIDVELEFSRL